MGYSKIIKQKKKIFLKVLEVVTKNSKDFNKIAQDSEGQHFGG